MPADAPLSLDALNREIAELESTPLAALPPVVRKAVEAQLAELRAQRATARIHGNATIADNARVTGAVVGVNSGTITQFFGGHPPADAQALLTSYLRGLIAEYDPLQLGKLLAAQQGGHEQSLIPTVSLRKVFTTLATTAPLREASKPRRRSAAYLQRLARSPRFAPLWNGELNDTQRPPDQVRLLERGLPADSPQPPREGHLRTALTQGGIDLDSLDPDTQIDLRVLRPTLALETLALPGSRVVLLGDPGSGKSTALRYLVVALADQLSAGTTHAYDLPGWRGQHLPVPLFCQLGTVAEQLRDDPATDLATLVAALLAPLTSTGPLFAGLQEPLLAGWHQGSALLCFDGLDEVSGVPQPTKAGRQSPRERVARAIRRLADRVGASRIVVTCRTRPYHEQPAWQLPVPWAVQTIAPFTMGQVRFFVPHWYQQTCTRPDPKYTLEQAQAQAAYLLAAIARSPGLHQLTSNPLLVTMLAILHYNAAQLPEQRAEVYEKVVELLLERWEGVRSSDQPGPAVPFGKRVGVPQLRVSDTQPTLYELAFDAHRQAVDGRGVIAKKLLEDTLDRFFTRELHADHPQGVPRSVKAACTEQFIALLLTETGLLQPDGDATYVVPHLTLEEYLAACHLAGRGDINGALGLWREAANRWREVLLLMVGRWRYNNKYSEIESWLRVLLSPAGKSSLQAQRDALLANASYGDSGGLRVLSRLLPEAQVRQFEALLCTALRALLAQPDAALTFAERLEAGRGLGQLDDGRFPVAVAQWQHEVAQRGTQFGRPAGYLCFVPEGSYTIGGWPEPTDDEDESGDDAAEPEAEPEQEQPVAIALRRFWIARLPITVAQFAPFVAEGYSAEAKPWWTTQGWKWKQSVERTQPFLWDDEGYSGANQPVIGVTWYEATAFCTWLTARLKQELPKGYVVRLPTEAEWEAAAAFAPGEPRRSYPWGKLLPTLEHAVFGDANLNAPAPVGLCPAGAAACGALDLVGNVWEWCASNYRDYPQQSDKPQKDLTQGGILPLRGGAYWSDSTDVRCGARFNYHPDDDFDGQGFRIVVASKLAG